MAKDGREEADDVAEFELSPSGTDWTTKESRGEQKALKNPWPWHLRDCLPSSSGAIPSSRGRSPSSGALETGAAHRARRQDRQTTGAWR